MSSGPHVRDISNQAKQQIGLDWCDWLDSDETIQSVSTEWQDSDGDDASSLETGTPSVDGSIVFTTKDANTGTPGEDYYVIFTVTTSKRVLGGDRIGTMKLRLTKNL